MDQAAFERVATSFADFHQYFAPLFGRKEAQRRSEQYLRGLLVQQTDRRNAENVAETISGATPRALQRLLTEAPWSTTPILDALQHYLAPRLSAPDGVFVLDETSFPKQGTHSVGVAHQYCGALGKVANCQVGVFLAYVSPLGHALVDARLYLPQGWLDDPQRCEQAGVPTGISFATKADLGLVMLDHARSLGQLQGTWVTADEWYGRIPELRDALDAGGWQYVLQVPSNLAVFTHPTQVAVPPGTGRGRRPTRPRVVAGSVLPQLVSTLLATQDEASWTTLTVAEGAQGSRSYQFAAQRVWESRDGLPGRECWLVLRRNLDGSEARSYLSNASAATSLWRLGSVGAQRWPIESEFQTEKGETGLDEYEVRSWRGWHHHISLALLAGAFLLQVQQEWGEKDAACDAAANQSRAARTAAASHMESGRIIAVAAAHASTQRTCQTVTYQTASC